MDHPRVDLEGDKTFEALDYPFSTIHDVDESCNGRLSKWVRQAVLLGSSYVVPLFIHPPDLSSFAGSSVWQLKTLEPVPEEQLLRHMRIAGYGLN